MQFNLYKTLLAIALIAKHSFAMEEMGSGYRSKLQFSVKEKPNIEYSKEFSSCIKGVIFASKHLELQQKCEGNIFNMLLLQGLRGIGNTTIANAIAKESGRIFIEAPGYYFSEPCYQGGDPVNELFDYAQKLSKPSIIFIDDFEFIFRDSLHKKRLTDDLLYRLNKITNNKEIFFIAATSEPEKIDSVIKSKLKVINIGFPRCS